MQCRGNPSFSIPFVSQSLKPLRPSFLNKQERGKELATRLYRPNKNILGYPRIFNFARALRDSLLQATTSNKSSRFILAKSKIHRRHKCVGLKITIYFITKTKSVLVMRRGTSGLLRR
jgi:hypothetical protein